ncbi:MAG TPA: BON domain-containing protein [Candidatus Limnocylindrales bacterium]|nr:BON domain-containing protein [Candidatus Limnocylindrales bacterium]
MRLQNHLPKTILILGMLVFGLSCGVPVRTPQQINEDRIITKKVLEKLEEVPLRAPPQDYLTATTQRGIVHVEGVVQDLYTKAKVIELIKTVEGVKGVTENIRIEEGPQGGR